MGSAEIRAQRPGPGTRPGAAAPVDSPEASRQARLGVLCSGSAYLLWGGFPLYFAVLDPAGPLEILAHRIVWSLLFTILLIAVRRRWRLLLAAVRDRRTLLILASAAVLIAANWGVYIYGVTSGQVVETSLGYFINPLVSVTLGVVVFAERLRRTQWVAVGIGVTAVVVLSVDYGRPPYIALFLAVTFGTYGLLKKIVTVAPVEGLAIESAVLTVPALIALAVLGTHGGLTFGSEGTGHAVLLTLAGVVTAVPLLLFAAGAQRVPLSTLGLLQYVTPCLQLALGLAVFHEPLPPLRLAGFALVWLALIVLSADLLRHRRRPVIAPVPVA